MSKKPTSYGCVVGPTHNTSVRTHKMVFFARLLTWMNLLWVWKGGLKCTLFAWKIFLANISISLFIPKKPNFLLHTHSCIILGYYINGSNITNITSSMLQTCQAINLDMGYEFVALRLVSISQTYECTHTSPIYTTPGYKNHITVWQFPPIVAISPILFMIYCRFIGVFNHMQYGFEYQRIENETPF